MKNVSFPNINEDKYIAGIQEVMECGSDFNINELDSAVDRIRNYLTDTHPDLFKNTINDNRSRGKIKELISEYVRDKSISVNGIEGLTETISVITSDILDFGILTDFIDDDEVEEIRVNGIDDVRIVMKGLEIKTERKFANIDTAINIAKKIVRTVGKHISPASPIVDARIKNGQRVACIIQPVALSGINLTIRKQRKQIYTLKDLLDKGTLSQEMFDFMDIMAIGEVSCMIVGPTNSGKTATLQSLIDRLVVLDRGRRIITLEDTAELNIEGTIAWETRKGVDLLDLLIHSLRQSPETLVLGEMRGREAQTVIAAANTGHQIYNTFHASGPKQAPKRILQMYMMGSTTLSQSMILDMVIEAFPLCVYQRKLRDGRRRVISITELVAIKGEEIISEDIFRYNMEGDRHDRVGKISNRLYNRLIEAGIDSSKLYLLHGGDSDKIIST